MAICRYWVVRCKITGASKVARGARHLIAGGVA